MMDIIIVADWYDGKELLYRGSMINLAKKAIRDRVKDTSGECELTVNAIRVYDGGCMYQLERLTDKLIAYYEDCMESVLADL